MTNGTEIYKIRRPDPVPNIGVPGLLLAFLYRNSEHCKINFVHISLQTAVDLNPTLGVTLVGLVLGST